VQVLLCLLRLLKLLLVLIMIMLGLLLLLLLLCLLLRLLLLLQRTKVLSRSATAQISNFFFARTSAFVHEWKRWATKGLKPLPKSAPWSSWMRQA